MQRPQAPGWPAALRYSVAATMLMVGAADGRLAAQADAAGDDVLIGEVLKRAGATLGSELSGPALASYVVVSAADGYRVVFSLAEADAALTGSRLLVADTANGEPLGEKQGPMRLVAPHDTRAARSARMLRRIEVLWLQP